MRHGKRLRAFSSLQKFSHGLTVGYAAFARAVRVRLAVWEAQVYLRVLCVIFLSNENVHAVTVSFSVLSPSNENPHGVTVSFPAFNWGSPGSNPGVGV